MQKQCTSCKQLFSITDDDLLFYDKISPIIGTIKYPIPTPTLCAKCRSIRRLSHRNGRTLYQRKCDGTGENIISIYHPDLPFPVYSVEHWYSDKWDALAYGKDFDFNRTFFEQFQELSQSVPRNCLQNEANENSAYTSYAGWNKDCYLVFYSDHNQQSFYIEDSFYNVNCLDCSFSNRNELCYELINSFNCYNSKFIYDSQSSADSWFLKNCVSCKNCIGCVNLRQKEYYIFNEKFTKDEYFEKLKTFRFDSNSYITEFTKRFQEYALRFPKKYIHGTNNENVSGDYINNSKNLKECYHTEYSQDCAYLNDCQRCKDCYDMDGWGGTGAELIYECQTVGEMVTNVLFSNFIISSSHDIYYSEFCTNGSNNLFGCSGLKKQQYCILNKQYTKEEYEALVPKIIEHMTDSRSESFPNGSWGEFFPSQLSCFGYNETQANLLYPLSKEKALQSGFRWRDGDPKDYTSQQFNISDSILNIADDICDKTLSCEVTGRNYKIIPQELAFYRKMGLPLPHHSPEQRHLARLKLQNPRILFDRLCTHCGTHIQTTFTPNGSEKVVCEKCYLALLY